MSLATIVLYNQNNDLNKKIINFGDYEMVYVGTNNTTTRRSVPGIELNEPNEWGEHNFMSLY